MVRAVETAGAPLASDPSLRALMEEMSHFPLRTRLRGQEYAASGRVVELRFDACTAYATVRGTKAYETLWEWIGDGWLPECSCPVAFDCKHAYALACCIVRFGQETHGFDDPLARRLLPPRVAMPSVSAPPRSIGAAMAAGRTPAVDLAAGSATLSRLRSARYTWEREQAASQLLAHTPSGTLSVYLPPFPEILGEPDPDLLCWRLAQEVARRAQGWLPPALEPFRTRPDLERLKADRARARLADDLLEWVARPQLTTQRSIRLVFSLVDGGWRGAGVSVEARVTTPRITDGLRTLAQLQQLRTELRRSPGLLPPDQAALLEWLVVRGVGGLPYPDAPRSTVAPGALALVLDRVAGSPLASWSGDLPSVLAERAGIVEGAPVRQSALPVRLLPTCVTRDGHAWIELCYTWPDGGQKIADTVVPLASTATTPERSMILADGEFSMVVEEPPPHIVDRFREAGGLPLDPEHRAAILSLLAGRFPQMQESLAEHTRVHAVRTVVALDLRDEEWLHLRLFAHSGPESGTRAIRCSRESCSSIPPMVAGACRTSRRADRKPQRPATRESPLRAGRREERMRPLRYSIRRRLRRRSPMPTCGSRFRTRRRCSPCLSGWR